MPISDPLVWLGVATTTTARIVARPEVDGRLFAAVRGQVARIAGDTVTSVSNDGIGVINLTGLTPGARYVADVYCDSTYIGRVYPRTQAESGTHTLAWASCIQHERPWTAARHVVDRWDADLLILQDDCPYTERGYRQYADGSTFWGETVQYGGSAPMDFSNYCAHHRAMRRHPAMRYVLERTPCLYTHGDHEYPGNDWDWGLSAANAGWGGTWASTQQDVDDAGAVAEAAVASYNQGNPINPIGGRYYWEATLGPATILGIDLYTEYDTGAGLRISAAQEAWLIDRAVNCGTPFVIISSGTPLYAAGSNDLPNTWLATTTQRNRIIDAIHDARTGVLWISGDRHHPLVHQSTKAVCVSAAPLGSNYFSNLFTGWTSAQVVWRPAFQGAAFLCYGVLHVTDEYLNPTIVDMRGNVRWSGRIVAGSNLLSYPRPRAAV